MSKARDDVLAERKRQIEVETWDTYHDDEHVDGELELAAVCYMVADPNEIYEVPDSWPWAPEWWKPKSLRENYVRAGALRQAETERLERAVKESRELTEIAIEWIELLDNKSK